MRLPSKVELKKELVELLGAELSTLEHAHRETKAGATHEEARPENDKDTRALEQSYLARGQAQRVMELRTALLELEAMPVAPFAPHQPVAAGALVTVEEDGEESHLFIALHGGGHVLAGQRVRVVTPRSPLGRAVIGKRQGDECEIRLPDRTREVSIVAVA